MAITNTSKPTTSLTNIARASFGETWGTIIPSWAAETRSWLATGSLFTGTTKQSSSLTNIAKPA